MAKTLLKFGLFGSAVGGAIGLGVGASYGGVLGATAGVTCGLVLGPPALLIACVAISLVCLAAAVPCFLGLLLMKTMLSGLARCFDSAPKPTTSGFSRA